MTRAVFDVEVVTSKRMTRETETLEGLLDALFEVGYGPVVDVEIERDGRWYRVALSLMGETTGLHIANDR